LSRTTGGEDWTNALPTYRQDAEMAALACGTKVVNMSASADPTRWRSLRLVQLQLIVT
jgi:hypothetical protein